MRARYLGQTELPLRGKSLVPILSGRASSVHRGAISQFGSGYAYRTERGRYIEWISGEKIVASELYDHSETTYETVNLAEHPEYQGLVSQLHRQMREPGESEGCLLLPKAN